MEKMLITDAHCHLYSVNDDLQLQDVIKLSSNVVKICENATSMKNFDRVIEIWQSYPELFIPSIGVHPMNYEEWDASVKERMEELLFGNPKLMVGEIGLHLIGQNVNKKAQIEVLTSQIELGVKYQRTISIHSVRSHGDMLKLFKKLSKSYENFKEINFVMHSYSGPADIMKSLLKLSGRIFFSFSLGLLNSKQTDVIEIIPLDNLLVETDSPYQLDESIANAKTLDNLHCKDINSSKINLPCNALLVLEYISKIRNISTHDLVQIVNHNFNKAFNLF